MDEPAPFRTFRTPEEAQALASDLELLGFKPTIEDSRNYISSAFVGASPEYFSVQLPPDDFLRAETALEEEADRQIAEVDRDHYLFSFSDGELLDVVYKPEEWNAFDRRLARKILTARGVAVGSAADETIREARLDVLSAPAPSQMTWVVVGYALSLLGGLFGVFIGHHLNTARKTVPNGERVYVYGPEDRAHGMRIFVIGAVMCFVLIGAWLSRLRG
jgi:hypothetical protein